MEKVVVAGGTGFLGYHISKKLIKNNYNVYSISKNPPPKKRYISKVKYLYYDLSKKKIYIKEISSCDYIINCSGYGRHLKKKNYYLNFYNNHFKSIENLINLFNTKKLKKFIQIGSSLEYSISKQKLKESSKCKPISIYGKVKLACSKYLLSLYKKNNFPVLIFRIFQAYGPKQDKNRLIPFTIDKCRANKKFNCTSGEQERDFIFIEDITKIILKSLKIKIYGHIFNLGSGESIQIKNLVMLIKKKIKKGYPQFGLKSKHHGEGDKVLPDLTKLKKYFKFRPKYKLIQGIDKLI